MSFSTSPSYRARLLCSTLLFALSVAIHLGCSSASEEALGPDASATGKGDDPDCQPRSCEADACGIATDGCGGSLDCGACACEIVACGPEDCGAIADGCGGTVDCGACDSCENDETENNSAASAVHLGTYTDNSGATGIVAPLVLVDTEEDWFVLGVEDACCIGNPKPGVGISAPSASADITVMMGYACGNESEASFDCEGGIYDEGLSACLMTLSAGASEQWMHLTSLNCSGPNESGTAFIRVQSAGTEVCENYQLQYEVTN